MKIDLQLPKVHDMTTDTVDIISTSAVTADVSPIVLSQTELLRFKFLPTLVAVSYTHLDVYKRQSHISLLIDMGFTALAIAERVGHESIDITYRYAHLFPTRQTEMADKLDFERMGT